MGKLQERYIVPPFSVFDTKQGYWQKRKKKWKELGLHSEQGRKDDLLGSGLNRIAAKRGNKLTGTSIFDPVLCEVIYNWFCIDGGIVFDPFAGGSVRGIVAEKLGFKYIGIDLSERQVDANQMQADKLGLCPVWHCDDSRNADSYIDDETVDLLFSCPPYHNLEKYSDHPLDLSNMNYADFLEAYADIIEKSCRKLKQNRFAVFVVGDIRDNNGAYRCFVDDTKRLFRANGLCVYNESILLETYGNKPYIAAATFNAKRKLPKVHQNVLIFYKGDIERIKDIYTQTEFNCRKI